MQKFVKEDLSDFEIVKLDTGLITLIVSTNLNSSNLLVAKNIRRRSKTIQCTI